MLLTNGQYDSAKSFYLSAIKKASLSEIGNKIEQEAACGYMKALLKNPITQNVQEVKYENELLISFTKIKNILQENKSIQEFSNLLLVSRCIQVFLKTNSNKEFYKSLMSVLTKNLSLESSCSFEDVINKLESTEKADESLVRKWITAVQLDKNFDHDDVEPLAIAVKSSLKTTKLDEEYIDKYLTTFVHEIREFEEYTDFDNKIKVLNYCKNSLNQLKEDKKNNLTLFSENWLTKIIKESEINLSEKIKKTSEDYGPELSLDVPITKVPENNGQICLSVSISNIENKAAARNIKLIVTDLNNNKLYEEKLENNLKGGSCFSTLALFESQNASEFSVNLHLDYFDDEGKAYFLDKKISISTSEDKFEPIRNPYITGKPVVTNDMFFGRDALIERLAESLHNDKIRCVIIYGQKRTGKSSVFEHLKQKLASSFIILNFSVGADITSELNFYKCVKSEFVMYLEDLEYEEQVINEFDNIQINDLLDFQKFISKINRIICKEEKKELLIMIDEFTHIYNYIRDPNCDLNDMFMDKWKAMLEKNLFKSALIGQDFMPEFIQKYANQFQVTDPVYVSYLEYQYALDLVVKPISLQDGTSRFVESSDEMIVDWFGGQPYYLQTYCSKLVNYINEYQHQKYITAAIAIKVKELMLSEVKIDMFDNLVRSNESDLLNLLVKIAHASELNDQKIKVSRLELSDDELGCLEKLSIRKVVEYTKNDGKCKILIPFFHEWLRRYY